MTGAEEPKQYHVRKGLSKMHFRMMIVTLLFVVGCTSHKTVALCYDPDIEAKEPQTLRIVDTFDDGHEEVNALFALLQRNDFPPGDYSFCGIASYIICEINDKPVCMAEVLSDGRTVTITNFANDRSIDIQKRNGEYVVYDNDSSDDVQDCFDIPEFCKIVERLSGRVFNKIEKHYNSVGGFN